MLFLLSLLSYIKSGCLLSHLTEAGMKLELVNRQVILPENATEPFQCHASTLVRLPCGTLVAAWFAGFREGSEDTAIWLSRYEHNIWTTPQRVAAREGKRTGIRCYFTRRINCGYFIK